MFYSLIAIHCAKQHAKCLFASIKLCKVFLLQLYFGCFHGGHLLQYLSSSKPSICLALAKKLFNNTLCQLAVFGKFPCGTPRTHSPNSPNGKTVIDFFHSYIHWEDFTITLHYLNRPRSKCP